MPFVILFAATRGLSEAARRILDTTFVTLGNLSQGMNRFGGASKLREAFRLQLEESRYKQKAQSVDLTRDYADRRIGVKCS